MKVSLYRQDVRLVHPIRASAQSHDVRVRLFLEIDDDGVTGFGEVAPQPEQLHGDPGLDEVTTALGAALELVQRVRESEGELPEWSRVARFSSGRPADHWAFAVIEMALFDRELRRAGASVTDVWPERFVTPRQVTVSLLDDAPWPSTSACARVRAKTAPGPVSALALARLEAAERPVLLDFNCGASSDDDVLAQLRALSGRVDVVAVEQPFAPGNLVDHARLREKMDVGLSLDEGVRSLRDVALIVRYGAASMLCVKPARVGGLANARSIVDRARDEGLLAYLGGFFESPFARRVHAALAATCVTEPSDLAPVDVGEGGEVVVSPGGFGLKPAPAMLASSTLLLGGRGGQPRLF